MSLQPPHSRVILVLADDDYVDNTTYTHTLWKVTLQDGSAYAVDITGAQYGWYEEPIIPWSRCQEERCNAIVHVNPSGTDHNGILDSDVVGDGFSVWKKDMMTGFDGNMKRRIDKEGWTAQNLLSMSDAGFKVVEQLYLEAVQDAVRGAAAIALNNWRTWEDGRRTGHCTKRL